MDPPGQPGRRAPPRLRLRRRRIVRRARSTSSPTGWRTGSSRRPASKAPRQIARVPRGRARAAALPAPLHRPRLDPRPRRLRHARQPAPGWSTPRPATGRRTTTPACAYGLDVYAPVDDDGRFTQDVAVLRREARLRRQPDGHRAARRGRHAARRRDDSPTPTRTAGAARSPSSSAPRRSGSSRWTTRSCGKSALAEIERCAGSRLGPASASTA